jgi:hypothetical protein
VACFCVVQTTREFYEVRSENLQKVHLSQRQSSLKHQWALRSKELARNVVTLAITQIIGTASANRDNHFPGGH